MNQKLVVIAQARVDSSRLPGKVLLETGGAPVIAHVIRRAQAIRNAAVVCCATSDRGVDDPVADAARAYGAQVFRGSATDVLSRYLGAARLYQADIVMRITCDCPLLDPDVCSAVAERLFDTKADYASNVAPPSFPHGLDCEVFTKEALEEAAQNASDPFDREHVTPWIRRQKKFQLSVLLGPGRPAADHRWTLDYPEDYELIRRILDVFPFGGRVPSWQDIDSHLKKHPELLNINRNRCDPNRLALNSEGVQRK